PPPPKSATAGQLYTYQVTATDADNDPLTFDLPIHPVGMAIDPTSGIIVWTPRASQAGAVTVVVRVRDGRGGTALQSTTITVPLVEPPSITSLPTIPAALNHAWTYQVAASDPSGNPLLYSLDPDSLARGLHINTTTGLITWTPGTAGDYAVSVTATDGNGLSATQNFTLPVVSADAPPSIISKPSGPVIQNSTWTYQVVAQDPDDATSSLTYSINPEATQAGMHIDSMGKLTWTPTMLGSFSAVITVTDPHGATGWQHITVPVQQAPSTDSPATITSTPAGPAMIDRAWQYLVQASDPDGQAVTLSVLHFKDSTGATITPAAGDYSVTYPAAGQMLIQWTPRDPNTYATPPQFPVHFDVSALDSNVPGNGQGQTQSFDLSVLGNAPPIILRAPAQAGAAVGVGSTFSFDVIDYNADPLTFQLVDVNGQPVSATFSPPSLAAASRNPNAPNTVNFTYTPTASGTQELRLRVSDGQATVEQPIKLIVQSAGAQQPTASLTARSVIAAGETFTAQVVASDPQNQPLTYSLQFFPGDSSKPVPTGMTIDPQSGLITWTPTTAQITADPSKPYKYDVIVSDGAHSVTLGPVSLTVVARLVNNPPVIVSDPTGTRASGDRPLIYDAKAVDPDNDPLTWTLVSGPATSRIDPNTGEFVWQPAASEFGQYEVARIQVSDPFGATAQQDIHLKAETSYVPVNSPPRIDSTPPLPGNGGETYTYFVHAVDPDGERVTFTREDYAGTPGDGTAGLTIVPVDANTAQVQWANPPAGNSRDFVIRATDERGASGTQRVLLTIGSGSGPGGAVDTPPTITSTPSYSVPAGTTYSYQAVANDPDGPPTYSVGVWVFDNTAADGHGAAVNWLSINGTSGALTGSTTTPGVYLIEVKATQNGVSAIQRYKLTVTNPNGSNSPPTIQPPAGPISAAVGQKLSYQVQASDADGDPLAYWLIDALGNPATNVNGLTVGATGLVTWTVPAGATDRGFKVRVIDSHGNYAEQSYAIHIIADQPPTISMTATTLTPAVGSTMGFVVVASDDVGLTDLHVTLTTSWAGTITLPVSASGLATYTVPAGAAGQPFTATATAVDTAGHSVTTAAQTITAPAADTSAPVVSVSNMGGDGVITQATDVDGRVYDPDNNLVYYALTATPADGGGAGAVILIKSGVFNGTTLISGVGSSSADALITTINPLALADGNYSFNLLAEDITGKTASV
ncbi:MAG: repeat-associated core domain protein, partial [Gemmatimonadales bacterium]|nr:repeat-associated core domain protein [Gemmatimonadales bacterium]